MILVNGGLMLLQELCPPSWGVGWWASWIVGSHGTGGSVWTSHSDKNFLSTKMYENLFNFEERNILKFSSVQWMPCQAVAPVCGCLAIIRFSPQARVGPHHHHFIILFLKYEYLFILRTKTLKKITLCCQAVVQYVVARRP